MWSAELMRNYSSSFISNARDISAASLMEWPEKWFISHWVLRPPFTKYSIAQARNRVMSPHPRGTGTWIKPSNAQVGEEENGCLRASVFFWSTKKRPRITSGPSRGRKRSRNECPVNRERPQVICALHKFQYLKIRLRVPGPNVPRLSNKPMKKAALVRAALI